MDQRWIAVGAACVVALGAGWWFGRGVAPVEPVGMVTSQSAPASELPGDDTVGGSVVVHVAGEVTDPGVYHLAEGSRVVDAIELAGGSTAGADLSDLNLAAPVADGQQVYVPGPGETPTAGVGSNADGLISLNNATADQLEGLPGVGPVLAERIVSHRESNGPFATVEDLLEVPGIGEAKLESMRDAVAVP